MRCNVVQNFPDCFGFVYIYNSRFMLTVIVISLQAQLLFANKYKYIPECMSGNGTFFGRFIKSSVPITTFKILQV